MAYANWGAFVYRHGKRREDREDTQPSEKHDTHHAVLGEGPVRLCGYKSIPILFEVEADGLQKMDIEQFRDADGNISGVHRGVAFTATRYENRVDLSLEESDRTLWTSTCGFEMGAGWDD